MRAKLKMIKEEMWRRMHQPIPAQGKWLCSVVNGYFNYHAVPTNAHALHVFLHHVTDLWRRTLRRRSQKDRMTWERMTQLVDDWLPKPIILHPWPSDRFAVTHPRWVRGALSNERPLYVADCLANKQILPSSEENGEPLSSLWPMSLCGRLGPVFQAPLFRLDGILGRA
jgi:hypothetical protein